ncbi:family 10 glycosylhydrolase [Bacillus massiliigorillae]|uniref:family 10 glycosylhydrolase n=1 Tax=Bacillus massiliigorillae TaxID=1243664 RepID=UPI0003A15239|nr:family 10 glycosylhydrolase [Bacillus massiliigorillae]
MMRKNLFRITMSVAMIFALLVSLLPVQTKAASNTTPKNEMRAAWIATVWNQDIPKVDKMDKNSYSAWVRTTLDDLKGKKFNTVIFQVKPMSDAFYPSKLAPWSSFATGTQGKNPGYDPLQIMLDEAHKRGMELHAWINPYRVATSDTMFNSLAANNVARTNPNWIVKYSTSSGNQYYLNPGLPEVQKYLIDTVKELVGNYDLDAVHMDDYFYPGKNFADQETFKKYGTGFKNIEDWRRDNVNVLVKDLYGAIKSLKPHVQFGISPRGIWRNKANDSTGSDTNGATNYDDIFADTRQWMKDGSIDYITPQIYWSRNHKTANYSTLLKWWNSEVQTYAKVHPVNLYIGTADYKIANDSDTAWNNKMELPGQIVDNRAATNVKGQMHFSLRDLQNNPLGYSAYIKENLYNYNALTPATSWKNSTVPAEPTAVQATVESTGIKLAITDNNSTKPRKYVIYRFDGSNEGSYQDPKNIVDVVYNTNGNTTFVDKTANPEKTYTYGVTAVSATGVESKTAAIAQVGDIEEVVYIFNDVTSKHRAFKEIAYLKEGNIVSGDGKGSYNPGQNLTRAEAAAMVGRALNLDGEKRNTSFKDVGKNNFASGYIQSAVDLKILSGYSDGSFKPDAKITRGEMAVVISKAFGYEFGGSLSGAAKALTSRGIAQGISEGNFGASQNIIRADYAIFLARAVDYKLRVNNPTISFTGSMTVQSDSLSIRKGPKPEYVQVGTLKKGDVVTIGYQVGSWSLIKSSNNVEGFVPTASLK